MEAHGFTIDALIDVFVADAFHATAAQAACLHDVDLGFLWDFTKRRMGVLDKKACSSNSHAVARFCEERCAEMLTSRTT